MRGQMNRRIPLAFFSICAVVGFGVRLSEVSFGCRREETRRRHARRWKAVLL